MARDRKKKPTGLSKDPPPQSRNWSAADKPSWDAFDALFGGKTGPYDTAAMEQMVKDVAHKIVLNQAEMYYPGPGVDDDPAAPTLSQMIDAITEAVKFEVSAGREAGYELLDRHQAECINWR